MEGRPPSEATLVANARKGDLAAYAELVRMHQDTAFRIAYLITGSAADAEESAQDGFLKAHAALDRFDERRPFRPWLLQIVANDARKPPPRPRAARQGLPTPRGGILGRRGPPARRSLLDRGVPVGPARCGRPLPRGGAARRDREVFAGLTDEELSVALELPVGTVKSRLSRALAKLRVDLELSA